MLLAVEGREHILLAVGIELLEEIGGDLVRNLVEDGEEGGCVHRVGDGREPVFVKELKGLGGDVGGEAPEEGAALAGSRSSATSARSAGWRAVRSATDFAHSPVAVRPRSWVSKSSVARSSFMGS